MGAGGGLVKKYYGMHFDLHDNLTPPVTLLHHPSAYLHGDQPAQEHYYGL